MTLGNKIQEMRKEMHLSQEELAEKMNVARQTISKWELGETSPNLEESRKLSQIFKISLDDLTNNDIKNILISKTDNNNKLLKNIFNIIKIICLIVITIILILIADIYFKSYFSAYPTAQGQELKCTKDGKEYTYEIWTKAETEHIIENFYTNDSETREALNIDITKYNDANKLLTDVKEYVTSHGGICK